MHRAGRFELSGPFSIQHVSSDGADVWAVVAIDIAATELELSPPPGRSLGAQ